MLPVFDTHVTPKSLSVSFKHLCWHLLDQLLCLYNNVFANKRQTELGLTSAVSQFRFCYTIICPYSFMY